jgi:hypothetical protein
MVRRFLLGHGYRSSPIEPSGIEAGLFVRGTPPNSKLRFDPRRPRLDYQTGPSLLDRPVLLVENDGVVGEVQNVKGATLTLRGPGGKTRAVSQEGLASCRAMQVTKDPLFSDEEGDLGFEKIQRYAGAPSQRPARIFVSVAAYRDPLLRATLLDLYQKASHPESIRTFCLVQQSGQDAFNVVPGDDELVRYDIELGVIDHALSQGVCWARAYCQKQFAGEEFFMQIDSHMRFAQGWDAKLCQMLIELDHPKGMVSLYPPGFDATSGVLKPALYKNQPLKFTDNHSLMCHGAKYDPDHRQHNLISAGFLFTRGAFCNEVPYDPHLYFQGEETDISFRSFAKGWRCFSPDECVIWHCYHKNQPEHRIRPWDEGDRWQKLKKRADERVRFKLQVVQAPVDINSVRDIHLYTAEGLSEFEEMLGVDFKHKLMGLRKPTNDLTAGRQHVDPARG